MKTSLRPVVVFLAGAAIGGLVVGLSGWWWVTRSWESTLTLLILHEISWEMQETSVAISAGRPAFAIAALEHSIKAIQRYTEQGFANRELLIDQGRAYVQLGLLLESEGNTLEAADAYSRGQRAMTEGNGVEIEI